MRKLFAETLLAKMDSDNRIYLVTADLGYKLFDDIRSRHPDRFFNTGAAEQAALGIAVGMAMSGKVPFVYSITPFLLWRPAETIRNYINRERIPVNLVGSGRGKDYRHDGFSHDESDCRNLMECFTNIRQLYPERADEIPAIVNMMAEGKEPIYLNLKR